MEGHRVLLSTAQSAESYSNLTTWYNLTSWAANVTRYAPSLEDLVWAGPRMFKRLGSYMTLPESLHHSGGTRDVNILRATSGESHGFNLMDAASQFRASADVPDASEGVLSQASRISLESVRGLGSVFSYATSRWALSCIAMAVVLNRTHIFAATRRRLKLRWKLRLILRSLPIMLLLLQARRLLQSIQCQTSPDFSQLRWGDAETSSDLMFAYSNKFLNTLSSTFLFRSTDEQSCLSINMIPDSENQPPSELQGSLSALWPLFGSFCLSHFVETVSCAVQGRPLSSETGMTLFEQSLAFAEADATINSQIRQINFSPKGKIADNAPTASSNVSTLTRSMILKKVNTPPEVLLVAFLSTMTHVFSHILGLFDVQAKYRLFNTGFWGLCFMASIIWNTFTFDLDNPDLQGLLRFPTVCIIGFVPHVLVLAGIALCLTIYGLALLLSALSPPPNQERSSMSFRQRVIYAHENMQANVSLAEVRISRDMDFYTALLRAGFAAITMASEAVYLNEDRGVSLKRHTWLEESRYREAEELQRQWIGMGLSNTRYDQIGAIGLIPVKDGPTVAPNGYARERAAQKVPKGRGEGSLRSGIGATERSSRWLMALEFFLSIARLLMKVNALMLLWALRVLRIRNQPAWLVHFAQHSKAPRTNNALKDDFDDKGQLDGSRTAKSSVSQTIDGIDVAAEFKRMGKYSNEDHLQQDLYSYFLEGGPWGSGDSSGDYVPEAIDDHWDTTSLVSMSTGIETDAETSEWESDAEGQKTPTQRSPRFSRENTPVVDSPMDMKALARLLQPASKEERDEATTLAAHLQSERVMTRSGFRRLETLRRTRVLTSPARPPRTPAGSVMATPSQPAKLSLEEEEQLLEQLLLTRRQAAVSATVTSSSEAPDGQASTSSDSEDQSPQCVVCQSSPRTIIVWPCRCLSLCDDCRVSLAMNNFDKCVCCRRDVLSFSRIYVP